LANTIWPDQAEWGAVSRYPPSGAAPPTAVTPGLPAKRIMRHQAARPTCPIRASSTLRNYSTWQWSFDRHHRLGFLPHPRPRSRSLRLRVLLLVLGSIRGEAGPGKPFWRAFLLARGSETAIAGVIRSPKRRKGQSSAGINLGAPSSAARYAPAAGQPSPTSTRSYSAAALRGSALTDPDTSARPTPGRDRRPTAATKLGFMSL
jgi:hypothetical protein